MHKFTKICITHHPYLVSYAFYTIPISNLKNFSFTSLPSFFMNVCMYEPSGFVCYVSPL